MRVSIFIYIYIYTYIYIHIYIFVTQLFLEKKLQFLNQIGEYNMRVGIRHSLTRVVWVGYD